jgi:hypothetical protein
MECLEPYLITQFRRECTMITNSIFKSSFRTLARVFLLLVPLILASPSKAYGYADPGTGAFLYQAAYAAFLGATFYLRKALNRFWGKRK